MRAIGNILGNITGARTESPIETQLYDALMQTRKITLVPDGEEITGSGIFLYTQYQVGKYRADFIIKAYGWADEPRVWPPKRDITLCVECDGAAFHTDLEKDKQRDIYFLDRGIRTIRFTGKEIYANKELCALQVLQAVNGEVWDT